MKPSKLERAWNIVYPVLYYYAVTILVLYAVDFFLPRTTGSALLQQLITSAAILPFLYQYFRREFFSQCSLARPNVILAEAVTGGCFAVAWNNLLGMVRIADYSVSYGQVEQTFYTGRLFLEIVALCVVIPLVEELLYRGIVYGRAKAFLGNKKAAILSAVLFGLVHMNLVQFVYAAVFGLLLAYFVEQGSSVWGAVAAHMTANVTSVLRAETDLFAFMDKNLGIRAFLTVLLFGAAAAGVYRIGQISRGSKLRS